MAKPFKIFLWIVGGLLLLLVGIAIALPLLVDPNRYKPQIAQAVKEQTGRDLSIGQMKLTIFPWLGANVQDVVLGNAPGFGPQPFARVGEAHVSVRVMPLLLDHRVEIGKLSLDGLTVNLEKSAQGNNWADLAKGDKKTSPQAPQPEHGPPMAFSIGGLQVKDANLAYTDHAGGVSYKLQKLDVETGKVELGQPIDFRIAFTAAATQPQVTADVKTAFTVVANPERQAYELRNLKTDVDAKGAGIPGGAQQLSVTGNARYDAAQGAFALSDAVIEALGLKLTAAIQGTGLTGDAPKLSGKLASEVFNPREVMKKLGTALPPMADASAATQARFSADYAGDFKSARLDNLVLQLDQTKATGQLAVPSFSPPAVTFALKADSFDADRYLAPAGAGKQDPAKAPAPKSDELPLDLLDVVSARGTAELGALKVKGLKLANVKLTLDAPKGAVKVEQLGAELYGGRVTQTARITPGAKPRVEMKAKLAGISAAPLLKDYNGRDFLSGTGNFDFAVATAGKTVQDLLSGLSGDTALAFVNGALEGINLKQTLAQAKAMARGQVLQAQDAPARTEFSDLKASGTITNGVLRTKSLAAKGDWYSLGGDGAINLAAQQIDYTLKPTITGSEDLKDLEGTTVPVKLTGALFSPKIRVDLEGVLKARARQEVDQQLKKQEDKLRERFGPQLDQIFKKK
ncbi:MAG TPA: AsmA family protein [Candidatus Binatia bacterium]|nr:AsmA family protein [Candidatus Binatia bacterium]